MLKQWLSPALPACIVLLLAGCGGSPALLEPAPPPPAAGGSLDGALDPALGNTAYSQVLRNTSGLPSGVKLTWTVQAGLTYNIYKSDSPIPNSARGAAALLRSSGEIAGTYVDDFSDQPSRPQIGSSWFYRISAVDADGDESRLSPELKVDITQHVAQAVDVSQARPGQQVIITGSNFGVFDAASDKVLCSGATWTGLTPGGFDLLAPLEATIDSWSDTSITVTLPADFIPGPLGVSINGSRSDSPFVDNLSPYLTSVSPLAGTAASTVTLIGRNFGISTATTSVSMAGVAGAVNSLSNTQLVFTPPVIHEYVTPKVLQVSNQGFLSNRGFFDLSNAAPAAALLVAKALGYGSLNARFDASACTDTEDDRDGTPLTFDYDFDGDGTYDLLDGGASPLQLFSTVGVSNVVLRVTDSDGAQSVLSPGLAVEVKPSLAGEWSMYGQGVGHARRSSSLGPPASHLPRRKFAFNNRVTANPVFAADGTLFVGSIDGVMHALNPDGTEKWRFPVAATVGPIGRAAAVAGDGTLYFADNTGVLFAIDSATGTQQWLRAFPGQLSNLTISSDNMMYVGCADRNLYALDLTPTGAITQWTRTMGNTQVSAPSIGTDGSIYAANSDGRVYAYASDGTPKWVYETNSAADVITGSIAVKAADSRLFFGTSDGFLYCISDAGNAAAAHWAQALNGAVVHSPAIGSNGAIYVATNAGQCYAIQDLGTTSAIMANFPGAAGVGPFTSPALGADNKVYLGSANGFVYCLDPLNLASLWQFDTGAAVNGHAAIGPDGVLYLGYDNNGLHALGISNPRPPSATLTLANGKTTTEVGNSAQVDFEVSASSPENVPVTLYEYDFDSDGTIDLASTSPLESNAYGDFGQFTATVRVTDENGLTNAVNATTGPIKVWSSDIVAPSAKYVRVADTTGLPAVAYIVDNPAGVPDEVHFKRMTIGVSGPEWPSAPIVLYQSLSLEVNDEVFDLAIQPDGSTGVVFADGIQLLFIKSLTDFGATWPPLGTPPSVVSILGLFGYTDASLIFNAQVPTVAFVMNLPLINGRVAYSRFDNLLGAWPAVPNHIALLEGGTSVDLAMINGHPALAFCGIGTGLQPQVQYVRANNPTGLLTLDWPLLPREVFIGTGLEECALSETFDPGTGLPIAAVAVTRLQTSRELWYLASDEDWALAPNPLLLRTGTLRSRLDLQLIGDRICTAWGMTDATGNPCYFLPASDSAGSNFATNSPLRLLDMPGGGASVSLASISDLGGGVDKACVGFTDGAGALTVCREP